MSNRLSIIFLILLLALAGCDNAPAPEANQKIPPPMAGADSTPEEQAPTAQLVDPVGPEPADQTTQPNPPAEVLAVVATVNGQPISGQMMESQVAMAAADRLLFGGPTELSEAELAEANRLRRLEMLSNLISLELASQEALRLGYAPKDEEVEEALTALKAEYEKPEDLRQLLEQHGTTEADLREQLTHTMALKKWQENDFLAKIKVSDQEARAFYGQHQASLRHGDLVRLSQIFLPIPLAGAPAQIDKAKAEATAKGQEALQRIRQGEDFGRVAAEMSREPEAAENRGDMGWMEKNQSLPVFDQSILEMEPGQVSELLESPLGFYIFKITEIRPAGLESFENVRADIVEYLSGEKMEGALRDKMTELFQKADIQILDPQLKEMYEGLSIAVAPAAPAADQADEPPAPAEELTAAPTGGGGGGPADNRPAPEK